MAQSKQQTAILELGKLLVKELDLETGVDTLSRWMAHYLAEKISEAEALPSGIKKNHANKECFTLILDLWKHRWHYKPERQPLRNFNELFEILERLDPDKEDHYYFRWHRSQSEEAESDSFYPDELKNLAAFAVEVDRVARVWIEYLLQTAAEKAKTEINQKLVELAVELRDLPDVEIIREVLINEEQRYEERVADSIIKKAKSAKLHRRINELKKFRDFNEFLIGEYENQMRGLDESGES